MSRNKSTKNTKTTATKGKVVKPIVKQVILGKLIAGNVDLTKAITALHGRSKKISVEIHTIACSILFHVDQHHDVTLADRLLAAVPAMASRKSLQEWFLKYGKLVWVPGVKPADSRFGYDSHKVTLLEDAKEMPFWMSGWKDHGSQPFDAQKAITSVLNRVVKATQAGGSIPADVVMHLQRASDILVKQGTKPIDLETGKQARPTPGDPLANPVLPGEALAA